MPTSHLELGPERTLPRIDSLVRGQGSCSFTAEKRFPKKPLKKVICAKAFCLVIALQMVAELEMTGTLTGTITTSSEVDFNIYGTVDVNPKGEADVSFNTPEITHQDPRNYHLRREGRSILVISPLWKSRCRSARPWRLRL